MRKHYSSSHINVPENILAKVIGSNANIAKSLPPLAKKYVLQMLYIDAPIPAKSLEEWVLPDGLSKHRVAIDRLIQLRVLSETIDSGKLARESMPSNAVRLPSLEELEIYALEQWERFLLHLISSKEAEKLTNFSSSMMKVFQRGLLSQREKEGSRLTEYGFQFLLMDTNAQLWYIIREYIANAEERGVDPATIISFLLELSFHETGQAYNINTLNEVQLNTIKDLSDLGLVKLQQGRKESWFLPTKLATTLSVSLSDTATRKQIVSFLQQNAHPRIAEKVPTVPENVTDQIRLWESDLNRVEMTPAQLYDEFPSKDLFESACDFAREHGALLWDDSKKMQLVVKAELHTEMREYLRRQK
uniref:RNA polymerase II transcription factor B subunit 2 n=1 Tax=Chenopodium quinoa TaxID=63459 RepID=A0A803LPW3_CHEQI